ncbi:hypothetical protein NON20_21465 [Synechocystis sp. B12]|jgi:hypothetical protein|nr:hypothetical protein NON20_21465 [Synechocystis sp. B12]
MFLGKNKKITSKLPLTFISSFSILFCTICPALAGVYSSERKISSIEWSKGKKIICPNDRGTEYYNIGGAKNYGFSRIAVICYEENRNNTAKWIITGGRTVDFDKPSYKTYDYDPGNYTNGNGEKPNIYKYSKFVIGENCQLLSRQNEEWNCTKYFRSKTTDNYLKTYGSNSLTSSAGYSLSLLRVELNDYIESNKLNKNFN